MNRKILVKSILIVLILLSFTNVNFVDAYDFSGSSSTLDTGSNAQKENAATQSQQAAQSRADEAQIEQIEKEELEREQEREEEQELERESINKRIEEERVEFEQMEKERMERNVLREREQEQAKVEEEVKEQKNDELLEQKVDFYPTPDLQSGIDKYKSGNYTGCIQELYSLTELDPTNAVAYYYLAMAYTYINASDEAVTAYEKVINLNTSESLVNFATIGRDCLTGGPACVVETVESDELDEFISAPYGNGLSKELNLEYKQKELDSIEGIINYKKQLNKDDVKQIKKFDSWIVD